jgi:hypothetical protein
MIYLSMAMAAGYTSILSLRLSQDFVGLSHKSADADSQDLPQSRFRTFSTSLQRVRHPAGFFPLTCNYPDSA